MSRNFEQSQVKDKWGVCLSCATNRFIVSRGLCMKCWKVSDIRERFKDKRIIPRNPINHEHCRILSNPYYTEPKKLFFLAYRLMKRYGERIQIDDLTQIGWVMMIKGVKDYNPHWGTSLFRFCKRGISSEMERHCQSEIRSSMMGVTEEDFVDYIKNDAMRCGGLSRYVPGMSFNITNHAVARYIERVNPTGTRKELRRLVEHSVRVPLEIEDLMLNKTNSTNELREYQGIYFVLGASVVLWSKQQQLITVFTKEQSAAFRDGKIQ